MIILALEIGLEIREIDTRVKVVEVTTTEEEEEDILALQEEDLGAVLEILIATKEAEETQEIEVIVLVLPEDTTTLQDQAMATAMALETE